MIYDDTIKPRKQHTDSVSSCHGLAKIERKKKLDQQRQSKCWIRIAKIELRTCLEVVLGIPVTWRNNIQNWDEIVDITDHAEQCPVEGTPLLLTIKNNDNVC